MNHIVIDARNINSSTGHYAERLLDYLQHIDRTNRYTVLVYAREVDFWQPTAANFTVRVADYRHYSLGEQVGLALLLYRLRPDLVHFTMPQQPLLWLGRRITTIHDLTLVRYENIDMNPRVYRLRKLIFTLLLKNVAWRSRRVITPTEYVRADLADWLGQRYLAKTTTTLEAGDIPHAQPEPIPKVKGLRYICFVGNAFPYKNLGRIVDAYQKLKISYPWLQLVFAGKKDYFYQQLEASITERGIKGVHILGYISEGQKRWLLGHAECHITASLSEGFHIPALEAMYEGCPVILSDASCLPEVGGDAALYFDPASTDDLVRVVSLLLDSPAERQRLIERGHARVKQFSWKRMARQTLRLYKDALA